MAKSRLAKVNEKIAETVVEGYQKIEDGVIGGFNRMTDRFVDSFLTKEGETVEQARKRIAGTAAEGTRDASDEE